MCWTLQTHAILMISTWQRALNASRYGRRGNRNTRLDKRINFSMKHAVRGVTQDLDRLEKEVREDTALALSVAWGFASHLLRAAACGERVLLACMQVLT
jgi:hypothetical protein